MSNLDKEKDYSNLTDALQFVFDQMLKNIYVSIPGIIESYDPAKKRCRVKPAINLRLTDGTTHAQSSVVNVPVIWPSGGGYTLISPLPTGTPVEIKFSQRGITKFKETYSAEDPGNGMFDKEDAHVIPSYGALEITPGSTTGMCLQKNDGSVFVCIENDRVEVKGDLRMLTGNIEMIAGDIIMGPGDITMATGNLIITAGNIVLGAGTITGPAVFGGAASDNHKHKQGNDSNGDIQVDTDGPS